MWKSLLQSARVGELADLLSPKLFRVFPASKMTAALRELLQNYRDDEAFASALRHRRTTIEAYGLPIELARGNVEEPDPVEHSHGREVLELYFHQLYDDGPTLLDLRRDRFSATDSGLVWKPTAVYLAWDPEFLQGVRDMYRGFYTDDDETFDAGLRALDLQGLGDVLLRHFGGDDQRSVRFRMAHFHQAFHEVFVQCEERDRSLHHQFAALGLYLATLYDHLGRLNESYDVRSAFEAAVG